MAARLRDRYVPADVTPNQPEENGDSILADANLPDQDNDQQGGENPDDTAGLGDYSDAPFDSQPIMDIIATIQRKMDDDAATQRQERQQLIAEQTKIREEVAALLATIRERQTTPDTHRSSLDNDLGAGYAPSRRKPTTPVRTPTLTFILYIHIHVHSYIYIIT